MNRSDRSAIVLAALIVIAVMLSHYPMRAAYTQDAGAGTNASKDVKGKLGLPRKNTNMTPVS
jgi:hypothetical protein